MAAEYELISFNLIGAPQLSQDGLTVTQSVNALSNQVGNTYESRYKEDTVLPPPTFLLADAANALTIIRTAASAFIAAKYPNT